jgi:hypothetical protein
LCAFAAHGGGVGLPVPAQWCKVMRSVERPHPELRTTARKLRQRVILLGCGLALGLIYVATMQLSAANAARPMRCSIAQRSPFFVGFAPGGSLDSFEPAALASREILHATRQWLCQDMEPASLRSQSLRQALRERHALRAEQIQFEDVPLSRAHLVLAQLAGANLPSESGWHVHVARGAGGYRVTHTSDQRLPANAK